MPNTAGLNPPRGSTNWTPPGPRTASPPPLPAPAPPAQESLCSALVLAAQKAAASSNPYLARSLYEQALTHSPDNIEALFRLASLGCVDEVSTVGLLRKAMRFSAERANASTAATQRCGGGAAESAAMEADGDVLASVTYNLALALAKTSDDTLKERAHLSNVVVLANPTHHKARLYLAGCLQELGRYEHALEALEVLLAAMRVEESPSAADVALELSGLYARGRALAELQQYQQASAAYRMTLEILSAEPPATLPGLAGLLYESLSAIGDRDAALHAWTLTGASEASFPPPPPPRDPPLPPPQPRSAAAAAAVEAAGGEGRPQQVEADGVGGGAALSAGGGDDAGDDGGADEEDTSPLGMAISAMAIAESDRLSAAASAALE